MTTIDGLMAENEMIAVGMVPLHPGVMDYADAKGKIILFVRDDEEGRSLFMSIETYGQISRTYEVRWDDWSHIVTKMAGDVIISDAADPYTALLNGADNGSTNS
jgi:hypothetical protein